MSLGIETVTILRAPRVSDHGTQVANWSGTLTTVAVSGCSVQPGAPAEDLLHAEGQRVSFTVFMPPTADVTGDDRLRIRGKDYPVLGDPEVWLDPDPNMAHARVLVASWRELT